MAVTLLDVNVLCGLLSENFAGHVEAQEWFALNSRHGWATCPFTQAGFVRLMTHPSASASPISAAQALEVLAENLQHPRHEFWPDDLGVAEALARWRSHLKGHQQITDAYLLALSLHHKGRLVTFDRGLIAFASTARVAHLISHIPE
ncbi:MAG: TA system VapC family ribonuclease toxin [Acidobacteriaceae bacterium]